MVLAYFCVQFIKLADTLIFLLLSVPTERDLDLLLLNKYTSVVIPISTFSLLPQGQSDIT